MDTDNYTRNKRKYKDESYTTSMEETKPTKRTKDHNRKYGTKKSRRGKYMHNTRNN